MIRGFDPEDVERQGGASHADEFQGPVSVRLGEATGPDGHIVGRPELVIEWRAHDGPKLDIAVRITTDDDGDDGGIVNVELPLADLQAALHFLTLGGPDEFTGREAQTEAAARGSGT